MALVAKPLRSSTPWSSATVEALLHEAGQPVAPRVGDQAVVGDVLGQPQLDLVRGRRQRLGAGVRVDDEQVHRVRSDVDDPEAHAPNVVAGARSRP